MHIDKKRNLIYHLTISGYELATLISLARWVAEGAEGELTPEALTQLKQVISNYDKATEQLSEHESR